MKQPTIILAIDSFKGSATSLEAETWVGQGIAKVLPDANLLKFPLADGGEGTVAAVTYGKEQLLHEALVSDALGNKIAAQFAMLEDGSAVIEMASVAGFSQQPINEENALWTSTFGVGQLILTAIKAGAKKIYVGLGGSATTDGGTGMAQALGVVFKNTKGEVIAPGLVGLAELATIDTSQINPVLTNTEVTILADVTNPLAGPNGAVYVYGPQKGLPQENLAEYDSWLGNYGELLAKAVGRKIASIPGAGAAGGLGAGLLAFTNAKVVSGIGELLKMIDLESVLSEADLVITGEGKMDNQSAQGKAPIGVAQLAKKYQKPVVALVGSRATNLSEVYQKGIDVVWSITPGPQSLTEAMAQSQINLTMAGENLARLFLLYNNL